MTANNPYILLCPGQGAQHVGMGKAFAEASTLARQLFEESDKILDDIELSRLCFEGPEDQLNRTDVSQPAIYVTSVACYRVLEKHGQLGKMQAAAGLSLGEFTALHLAGAYDFETGLRLVRLRGKAMQQAAEATPSGMVALVGVEDQQAYDICLQAMQAPTVKAGEVLVPANFNCPGQVVISGSLAACQRALSVAKQAGVRATPLKVAGAFHSPLMQPAADRLGEALDLVKWQALKVPVVSNVDGTPHELDDPESIRQLLVQQLTQPVRWTDSIRWLAENVAGDWHEMAPGKVLAGLMRRIDRNIRVQSHPEPSGSPD